MSRPAPENKESLNDRRPSPYLATKRQHTQAGSEQSSPPGADAAKLDVASSVNLLAICLKYQGSLIIVPVLRLRSMAESVMKKREESCSTSEGYVLSIYL